MIIYYIIIIDVSIQNINIRLFDGDKPSPLSGVKVSTVDSTLNQHGTVD